MLPLIFWAKDHWSLNHINSLSSFKLSKIIGEYVIKDTLTFAEIIHNKSLKADKKYVSYDVETFFSSIPVNTTTDYIMRIKFSSLSVNIVEVYCMGILLC